MSAHMKPQRTRNKFAREERQRKSFEAEVRKELAAKRTPQEQLARLDAGGFVATKERMRLIAKIMGPTLTIEQVNESHEATKKVKVKKVKKNG